MRDLVGPGLSNHLAQATSCLIAKPIAKARGLAWNHRYAARRQRIPFFRLDQFDSGGDIDAIEAAFCGDPHRCNAIRNRHRYQQLRLSLHISKLPI
jgi:hypothetical protein